MFCKQNSRDFVLFASFGPSLGVDTDCPNLVKLGACRSLGVDADCPKAHVPRIFVNLSIWPKSESPHDDGCPKPRVYYPALRTVGDDTDSPKGGFVVGGCQLNEIRTTPTEFTPALGQSVMTPTVLRPR